MSNLNDLHEALAQELLQRIKSGEAKAPDLAVAAKFLKDNEITAVPANNNALSQLLESMPFPTEEDLKESKIV